MHSRSAQAKLTPHHLLAVCALAIGAVAAAPNDADVEDDASTGDATTAPVADASVTTDATTTPVDATVTTPPADAATASEASGDDASDDGPQYVTPDGALPPYDAGDPFSLLCVANPHETDLSYSSFPAPYTGTAGCIAFNPLNEGHPAPRTCLCNNCYTLQQQCDAIPGCQAIQKCAFDTGCTTVDSCYLVQGLCAAVINQWGNGSVATALADELNICGQALSPPCPAQ
jgi:hypothetical protein